MDERQRTRIVKPREVLEGSLELERERRSKKEVGFFSLIKDRKQWKQIETQYIYLYKT